MNYWSDGETEALFGKDGVYARRGDVIAYSYPSSTNWLAAGANLPATAAAMIEVEMVDIAHGHRAVNREAHLHAVFAAHCVTRFHRVAQ